LTATPADFVYDWAITAGGGSLSAESGESVIYTAPATNAECANNPTIELSCNGVVLDTLQLAVNAYTSTEAFYVKYCKYDCKQEGTADYCALVGRWQGGCDNAEVEMGGVCGGGSMDPSDDCAWCTSIGRGTCVDVKDIGDCSIAPWAGPDLGEAIDVRNAYMITNGCCPAALI